MLRHRQARCRRGRVVVGGLGGGLGGRLGGGRDVGVGLGGGRGGGLGGGRGVGVGAGASAGDSSAAAGAAIARRLFAVELHTCRLAGCRRCGHVAHPRRLRFLAARRRVGGARRPTVRHGHVRAAGELERRRVLLHAPLRPPGQCRLPRAADAGSLDLLYYYYGANEAMGSSRCDVGTNFAAGWDDVSRREMLTKGSAYRFSTACGSCSRRASSCASASVPARAWRLELPVRASTSGKQRGRRSPARAKAPTARARATRSTPRRQAVPAVQDLRRDGVGPHRVQRGRARRSRRRHQRLHRGRRAAPLPRRTPPSRAYLGALAPQRAFKSASLVGLVKARCAGVRGGLRPGRPRQGRGGGGVGVRGATPSAHHECDASVGEMIHTNMWLNADVNVKAARRRQERGRGVRGCLGITCAMWAACSATTASISLASSRAARRRRRRRAPPARRRRMSMTTASPRVAGC